MVESPLCQRLRASLLEAAASKARTEVHHEVVLIVLSVTEHLCQTQANVVFPLVYFMARHALANGVKAAQELAFQLKSPITFHDQAKYHVHDEDVTARGCYQRGNLIFRILCVADAPVACAHDHDSF